MKKTKKGSGLYNFLTASGVLSNGSIEEIEQQKRLYWKQYRKQWKKNKRQQNKTYMLLYSFKEARLLHSKAEAHSLSVPAFIKHASLISQQFTTSLTVGKIREVVMQFTNSVVAQSGGKLSEQDLRKTIVENVINMENQIIDILQNKLKYHHN